MDTRLTGLLTGDGFVFAVAAFLTTGAHRGLALAATVLALVAGYVMVTAQQYAAEKTPGLVADGEQLGAAYRQFRRRQRLTKFATPLVGLAILLLLVTVVWGMA